MLIFILAYRTLLMAKITTSTKIPALLRLYIFMHQNNCKKWELKYMRIIRMETQFRVSSFVCFSHEFVRYFHSFDAKKFPSPRSNRNRQLRRQSRGNTSFHYFEVMLNVNSLGMRRILERWHNCYPHNSQKLPSIPPDDVRVLTPTLNKGA